MYYTSFFGRQGWLTMGLFAKQNSLLQLVGFQGLWSEHFGLLQFDCPLNPWNPKSDKHLISPCSNSAKYNNNNNNNNKDYKNKGKLSPTSEVLMVLTNSPCQYQRKSIKRVGRILNHMV